MNFVACSFLILIAARAFVRRLSQQPSSRNTAEAPAAILRAPGQYVGRSKAVSCADVVWTVATAGIPAEITGLSIEQQTENCLATLEQNLEQVGSNK